jgi:hypothetical protein
MFEAFVMVRSVEISDLIFSVMSASDSAQAVASAPHTSTDRSPKSRFLIAAVPPESPFCSFRAPFAKN